MGRAAPGSLHVLARLHTYLPEVNAGSERMVHSMLRALAQRGHRVEVEVPSVTWRTTYALDGVRVRYGDPAPDRPDVVVSHLGQARAAWKYARHRRVPFIHIVHNDHPATARTLDRYPADLAVFNSEWLRAHHGRPGIVVRPPVVADEYRVSRGRKVTLVNLSADKGADVFWELAQRMHDVKFLGVIGGYDPQVVRHLPNVEIRRQTFHMREVYRSTRVLLMPSRVESWGRVGVEAMCSGIPVVAHPTQGLQESLGAAGIFVDRADVSGWEKQVRRLLSERNVFTRASRAARRRAVELDPTEDLERWCAAVESMIGDPVAENFGVFSKDGDIRTAATPAEAVDLEYRGWVAQAVDADGKPLRGQSLDAALEEADLPKAGTAEEKRARLAQREQSKS